MIFLSTEGKWKTHLVEKDAAGSMLNLKVVNMLLCI